MTISANVEWKLETAFIAVANDSTDITGIARVAREGDATQVADGDMFPVLVVGVDSTQEDAISTRDDQSVCYVFFDCRTLTRGTGADTTGETVSNLQGAVRDMLYDSSLTASLNGKVSGLFVYEVRLDEPTTRADDDRYRSRIIVAKAYARAIGVG